MRCLASMWVVLGSAAILSASCAPARTNTASRIAIRPTRLVLVTSDRAARGGDPWAPTALVGTAIARDRRGRHVEVELNDGRRVWVQIDRVIADTIDHGDRLALRGDAGGSLFTARVVERMDELLVIEREDGARTREMVSIATVVARLSADPASPEDGDGSMRMPSEIAMPWPEAAHEVTWAEGDAWAPARLVRCDAAPVVLYGDGSSETVTTADIADARIAPGEKVAVSWHGPTSFAATVQDARDGVLLVRFDRGESEWVPIESVRAVYRAREDWRAAAAPPELPCTTRGVVSNRETARWVLARRWSVRAAGTLTECSDSDHRATIVRRTGASSIVELGTLSALEIQAGDQVQVRWRDGATNLATVRGTSEGRSVDVAYEDGSTETVSLRDVLAHLPSARRPAATLEVPSARAASSARCPTGDPASPPRAPLIPWPREESRDEGGRNPYFRPH